MRCGALLLDGAQHERPLRWLYQQYPDHEPRLLLHRTAYAEIADFGPVLVQADKDSALYNAWRQGERDLLSAVWLESLIPLESLFKILQRRLRIYAPDGREFWIRLGDASPLRQAWLAGAEWPKGFWHGVSAVWLPHEGIPVLAWPNEEPDMDCAPADSGLAAQVTLDWPLLEALTLNMDSDKESQV